MHQVYRCPVSTAPSMLALNHNPHRGGCRCRTGAVRVGFRILKPETAQRLRRELRRGELSRAALGRGLCERDGWRDPRGELCAASAHKTLPRWYEARWGIEEYFRVLKTGTRIEDRRLQEAGTQVKCLALDAATVWRVWLGVCSVWSATRGTSDCCRRTRASGHPPRRSSAGSCCWDGSRAGGRQSVAHFPATRCFGALTCKGRACRAASKAAIEWGLIYEITQASQRRFWYTTIGN